PQLEVRPGAQVVCIRFSDEPNAEGQVTATGAEFIEEGENRFAKALKEVIVCGGAYQTPQVLELSGIGDSEILDKFNIKQVVDLPGVGRNLRTFGLTVLQEHIYVPTAFELKDGLQSWDELQNPQRLQEEIEK
ncbi:GMC oxidoreductase-domain-containing protein, partial [Schizophyllum fasciatum]